MPKETFYRLKPAKKKALIDAFLEEFSQHLYEDASITSVVKKLGIAKGSVYQYFEDKLDLYLYLKRECEKVKMEYIMHVKRENYSDFWTYYRELYSEGIQFDLEHSLKSRFLYNISNNERSSGLGDLHKEWRNQALEMFSTMIQNEINCGHFRDDIPVSTMAYFLYSISSGIGEHMQSIYKITFDTNEKDNEPVFAHHSKLLLQLIDEYILLLKDAFNNKNHD